MIIRLASRADLPLLPGIERAAAALFRGTPMDFAADGAVNAPATFAAAHKRDLLWVAVVDGAAAGFMLAEPSESGLYLREMAVAPLAQRRGLGAALLAVSSAAAKPRGLSAVWLTTDRTLPWNAPFYARQGFTFVEGDAVPADLRRRLQGQAAAGFDPARRCAMVRPA